MDRSQRGPPTMAYSLGFEHVSRAVVDTRIDKAIGWSLVFHFQTKSDMADERNGRSVVDDNILIYVHGGHGYLRDHNEDERVYIKRLMGMAMS